MSKLREALQGKARRPESFFGQVVSYGQSPEGAEGVLVNVMDKGGKATGEQRLVTLDTAADIKLGEGKERPGIGLFAKKGKSHTPPGGVLRIESAMQVGSVWKARWVTGAVHKPGAGSVATLEGRVGPLRESAATGRPYRTLDALHLDDAVAVTSTSELEAAVKAAIIDVQAGNVMVREVTEDGKEIVGRMFGARGETAEERVAAVLSSEGFLAVADVVARNAQGTSTVEVIPVRRHFFGTDSAKAPMLDKLFVNTSEDQTRQYARGFRPLLVSFKAHEDGTEFVTGAAYANGQGFARFGHAASIAPASAAQAASASDEEFFDDDDLPDVDLAALMDAASDGENRNTPGMG